jgi:hypothetical protein
MLNSVCRQNKYLNVISYLFDVAKSISSYESTKNDILKAIERISSTLDIYERSKMEYINEVQELETRHSELETQLQHCRRINSDNQLLLRRHQNSKDVISTEIADIKQMLNVLQSQCRTLAVIDNASKKQRRLMLAYNKCKHIVAEEINERNNLNILGVLSDFICVSDVKFCTSVASALGDAIFETILVANRSSAIDLATRCKSDYGAYGVRIEIVDECEHFKSTSLPCHLHSSVVKLSDCILKPESPDIQNLIENKMRHWLLLCQEFGNNSNVFIPEISGFNVVTLDGFKVLSDGEMQSSLPEFSCISDMLMRNIGKSFTATESVFVRDYNTNNADEICKTKEKISMLERKLQSKEEEYITCNKLVCDIERQAKESIIKIKEIESNVKETVRLISQSKKHSNRNADGFNDKNVLLKNDLIQKKINIENNYTKCKNEFYNMLGEEVGDDILSKITYFEKLKTDKEQAQLNHR